MVIWVTGISGAGKTTLCDALKDRLKPTYPAIAQVDGDQIRELFGSDLDFSEPSRVIQIKRIQRVAKFLADQGLIVLVSALYAHPDLLLWNRKNFEPYFEIYLDAPLSLVRDRDPKGLYAKADSGNMANVVGLDIPWHAPVDPNMTIDQQRAIAPEQIAIEVEAELSPYLRRLTGTAQTGDTA